MIDYFKTQGEWKIQLTMAIKSISKDSDETQIMHSTSDTIKIMIGNETDEIIEELFDSLSQRYQKGLEEKMRDFIREFIFDSVDLLH